MSGRGTRPACPRSRPYRNTLRFEVSARFADTHEHVPYGFDGVSDTGNVTFFVSVLGLPPQYSLYEYL